MSTQEKPNKLLLAAIAVVHVSAAALTWQDLRARPGSEVRGDKRLWRIASVVNTLGSVAYWLFARRRNTTAPAAATPNTRSS